MRNNITFSLPVHNILTLLIVTFSFRCRQSDAIYHDIPLAFHVARSKRSIKKSSYTSWSFSTNCNGKGSCGGGLKHRGKETIRKQKTILLCSSESRVGMNTQLNMNMGDGEVVGHKGRIGSFLLRENTTFLFVPKEISPGTYSPADSPIYVSVPATQVGSVIDKTIQDRRNDLVFITNGIPSDFVNFLKNANERTNTSTCAKSISLEEDLNFLNNTMTMTVPHFGILRVGDNPLSDETISPPTIIYGKHANRLKQILELHEINVQIVSTLLAIDAAAIRKLLWVSSMWLLCHDPYSSSVTSDACTSTPMDVSNVHKFKNKELCKLVEEELYPAAVTLLEEYHNKSNANARQIMGTVNDVLKYMESYSLSMPGACPNKQLAIDEIEQRNGVLLSVSSVPQPLHRALIKRVMNVGTLVVGDEID